MRARDLETLELPRVLDAIAALARSAEGREAVRALRPTPDGDEADRRLATAAELASLVAEAGAPPLADVPPLARALAAAAPAGAALEPLRLAEVRSVLGVARAVRVFLGRDPARFPRLAERGAALAGIPELEGALGGALDERGQVRDDASPALAAARAVTRSLRTDMEARLEQLLRDPAMSDVIGEHYVTIRNGRFVIPVRASAMHAVPGVFQDRSQSGETVFLEPLFAVEMNNRLLLAARDEEAEERRLRAELTDVVRAHASRLHDLEAALAGVDALAAAGAFAARHGCTRPRLDGDEIALRGARHPLLLEHGRRVVPVDILVASGRQGLAITGPNAGGKTVALKTLGLCALMARTGLFVPAAEGSTLPAVTAVLADIGDEQSIDRDLSTFSAHVENLAGIAQHAAPGALVLLDEPGAGTDPVEGAALAVGLLTDLLARGARVVFTSHFAQVKTFALGEPLLEVAAFDVDPETGAPRFRLSYHTVGQSLALPIARRHGLPARAIETAERLLAGESQDLARALARLEESRRAFEERRDTLERERAELAAARAEVDALGADLRARQRRRWADDLEESRRFVRELQVRGQALLDELRARPEPAALRTFVRNTAGEIDARARDVGGEEVAATRAPEPGDAVEVVGRGIRGELVEIAGERAWIRRGGLRFEVPSRQLRLAGRPEPKPAAPAPVEHGDSEEEINLVGQRARDALDVLARFLDHALRAGLAEVRVVHGVGTGALRRAVREFLDASPYCAGYRDAEPAAGGAGVTIAELA